MKTELKFTDFEPKDLVGRKVLMVGGGTWTTYRSIEVIEKAHKKYCLLKGKSSKFDYNGYEIRGRDASSYSPRDTIRLLTTEQEAELRAEFAETSKRIAAKKEFETKFAEFQKTATSQQWENLIKAITQNEQ